MVVDAAVICLIDICPTLCLFVGNVLFNIKWVSLVGNAFSNARELP
jgi:hypothetical protein